MVDKEAFSDLMDHRTSILKEFWRSPNNKIIVARKAQTGSIVGYACYLELGEKEGAPLCYMMRIAVRNKCQRMGIGRKIVSYLLDKYPQGLSLDVNAENAKAISFYSRIGLKACE